MGARDLYLKSGGNQLLVTKQPMVKIGGAWVGIKEIYHKHNNTWNTVWLNEITVRVTSNHSSLNLNSLFSSIASDTPVRVLIDAGVEVGTSTINNIGSRPYVKIEVDGKMVGTNSGSDALVINSDRIIVINNGSILGAGGKGGKGGNSTGWGSWRTVTPDGGPFGGNTTGGCSIISGRIINISDHRHLLYDVNRGNSAGNITQVNSGGREMVRLSHRYDMGDGMGGLNPVYQFKYRSRSTVQGGAGGEGARYLHTTPDSGHTSSNGNTGGNGGAYGQPGSVGTSGSSGGSGGKAIKTSHSYSYSGSGTIAGIKD